MELKAPRAGERRVLASSHRRCLYEQPFYYSDGKGREKEETYSFWGYQGTMPVIIFPVTDEGHVIAIRQFRHCLNNFLIETPGGLPKHREQPPEEVARAELLEETGYEPADVVVYPKIQFDGMIDAHFTPCIGFGCIRTNKTKLDRTEVLETILMPIREWYEKIQRGEINTDAKYFALSLLALPLLKERLGFSL